VRAFIAVAMSTPLITLMIYAAAIARYVIYAANTALRQPSFAAVALLHTRARARYVAARICCERYVCAVMPRVSVKICFAATASRALRDALCFVATIRLPCCLFATTAMRQYAVRATVRGGA